MFASLFTLASLAAGLSYQVTRRLTGHVSRSQDAPTQRVEREARARPRLATMTVATMPEGVASRQTAFAYSAEVSEATANESSPQLEAADEPVPRATLADETEPAPGAAQPKAESSVASASTPSRPARSQTRERVEERAAAPARPEGVKPASVQAQPAPAALQPLQPPQQSTTALSEAQLTAATRIVDLEVQGSLGPTVVRRAAERIRPALARCYAGTTASPPQAAVELRFIIDETGHTRYASVDTRAPELNACLRAAVGKLACRAPDTGTVQAALRIKFSP